MIKNVTLILSFICCHVFGQEIQDVPLSSNVRPIVHKCKTYLKVYSSKIDSLSKWTFSLNTSSFIRDPRVTFPNRLNYISSNSLMFLEAQYDLTNHIAVRFPVLIGLQHFKDGYSETYDDPIQYYYMPHYSNQEDLENGPNISKVPYFNTAYHIYPKEGEQVRYHDIVFQFGFNYQVMLINRNWLSLYTAASINFGLMDKYQLSYYHDFDSIPNSSDFPDDDVQDYWQFRQETVVFKRDPFMYWRPEGTIGLNFKLARHFNLKFETGFSSYIDLVGKKPDKVFMSLNVRPYTQNLVDFDKREKREYLDSHFWKPHIDDHYFEDQGKGFYLIGRIWIGYTFAQRSAPNKRKHSR